jgi:hypothetical protein
MVDYHEILKYKASRIECRVQEVRKHLEFIRTYNIERQIMFMDPTEMDEETKRY